MSISMYLQDNLQQLLVIFSCRCMELDIQSLIHVVETNDHIDLRATAGYLVGAWSWTFSL
jgi:hypothetical protein